MKLLKKMTIMIVLIICAASLQAEDILTLEKARILAADNSITLKNTALSMEAAELKKTALKYGLFPVISATGRAGASLIYSAQSSSPVNFSPSVGLSVKQNIYNGGKYPVQKQIAGVDSSMAHGEWEDTFLQIRNECDTLYFSFLESQSQEEAAKKTMDAANSLLNLTEGQFEAGIISKITYLKAKADAATKEMNLLQMKKNSEIAGEKLASYLSLSTLPQIQEINLDKYMDFIHSLNTIDSEESIKISEHLTTAGMNNAPDLLKSKLIVNKAQLEVELTKKQYTPTIDLSLSDSVSMDSKLSFSNNSSVTLSGSISLSSWDKKSTVRQAEIAVEQAANTSAETARQYILKVQSEWYDLLSASQSVIASKAAMDYAEESYNETFEKYKLSTASYSDLVDAEALLSSNKSQYISAQFDFLKSLSTLEYIVGAKDEKSLWDIIKI